MATRPLALFCTAVLSVSVLSTANAEVSMQTQIRQQVTEALVLHESIVTMHRFLFTYFSMEVQLPVRAGGPDSYVLTASDLARIVQANTVAPADRELLLWTLRQAIVEYRAGYYQLDDRAKYHLTFTPTHMQEGAISTHPLWWYGAPDDVTDEVGAINYLRRKNALLKGEFADPKFDITPYLSDLDKHVVFRNTNWTLVEHDEAAQLFDRYLNAGFSQPALTDVERARINTLGILPGNKFANIANIMSGNFALARMLSGATVQDIFREVEPRRLAARGAVPILSRTLQSVTADITPETARTRVSQAVLRIVAEDQRSNSRKWHPLSIVTMLGTNGVPELILTDSVVASAYAACAGYSYRMLALNAAGRWQAMNAQFVRRASSADLLWFREKDYLENKIVKITIMESTEIQMNTSAFLATLTANIRAYDDCLLSVLGFAMAHELAHVYLSADPRQVTAGPQAELAADCAAQKTIRRLAATRKIDLTPLDAFGKFRTLIENGGSQLGAAFVSSAFQVEAFVARMKRLHDAASCAP